MLLEDFSPIIQEEVIAPKISLQSYSLFVQTLKAADEGVREELARIWLKARQHAARPSDSQLVLYFGVEPKLHDRLLEKGFIGSHYDVVYLTDKPHKCGLSGWDRIDFSHPKKVVTCYVDGARIVDLDKPRSGFAFASTMLFNRLFGASKDALTHDDWAQLVQRKEFGGILKKLGHSGLKVATGEGEHMYVMVDKSSIHVMDAPVATVQDFYTWLCKNRDQVQREISVSFA